MTNKKTFFIKSLICLSVFLGFNYQSIQATDGVTGNATNIKKIDYYEDFEMWPGMVEKNTEKINCSYYRGYNNYTQANAKLDLNEACTTKYGVDVSDGNRVRYFSEAPGGWKFETDISTLGISDLHLASVYETDLGKPTIKDETSYYPWVREFGHWVDNNSSSGNCGSGYIQAQSGSYCLLLGDNGKQDSQAAPMRGKELTYSRLFDVKDLSICNLDLSLYYSSVAGREDEKLDKIYVEVLFLSDENTSTTNVKTIKEIDDEHNTTQDYVTINAGSVVRDDSYQNGKGLATNKWEKFSLKNVLIGEDVKFLKIKVVAIAGNVTQVNAAIDTVTVKTGDHVLVNLYQADGTTLIKSLALATNAKIPASDLSGYDNRYWKTAEGFINTSDLQNLKLKYDASKLNSNNITEYKFYLVENVIASPDGNKDSNKVPGDYVKVSIDYDHEISQLNNNYYFINPKEAVVLTTQEIPATITKNNENYHFSKWQVTPDINFTFDETNHQLSLQSDVALDFKANYKVEPVITMLTPATTDNSQSDAVTSPASEVNKLPNTGSETMFTSGLCLVVLAAAFLKRK